MQPTTLAHVVCRLVYTRCTLSLTTTKNTHESTGECAYPPIQAAYAGDATVLQHPKGSARAKSRKLPDDMQCEGRSSSLRGRLQ
jgi:hypothetical protein